MRAFFGEGRKVRKAVRICDSEDSSNFADMRRRLGQQPRLLWVVSSGGHLKEALLLESVLGYNSESTWICSDADDSADLLRSRRHYLLPYQDPRDVIGAMSTGRKVVSLSRTIRYSAVVSTGAAIASFALPMMAARGASCWYIESLAREIEPSLTGRIARLTPRVRCLCQYESSNWSGFEFQGSLLAAYGTSTRQDTWRKPTESSPLRVFVTLGTSRKYRFDRLIDWVVRSLDPRDEVSWQLGFTPRSALPGVQRLMFTEAEFKAQIQSADVIVTHAGVGTLLTSLGEGKAPVIGVRDPDRGEHIDGHQAQIANELERRGLGCIADLGLPSRSLLWEASLRKVQLLADL